MFDQPTPRRAQSRQTTANIQRSSFEEKLYYFLQPEQGKSFDEVAGTLTFATHSGKSWMRALRGNDGTHMAHF